MAILVDTNTLSAVFLKKNKEHTDFFPVLEWVIKGKSKFVFGGTKYIGELQNAETYLRLLLNLRDLKKAYIVEKSLVDKKQKEIEELCDDKDFNDAHMIAILVISHTKVFCTNDKSSFKYVTNGKFYDHSRYRPKIYTNIDHKPKVYLLCDSNLTDIDRPYVILNKDQIEKLGFF